MDWEVLVGIAAFAGFFFWQNKQSAQAARESRQQLESMLNLTLLAQKANSTNELNLALLQQKRQEFALELERAAVVEAQKQEVEKEEEDEQEPKRAGAITFYDIHQQRKRTLVPLQMGDSINED